MIDLLPTFEKGRTSRHRVCNPVRGADSRTGEEDGFLADESNGGRLDRVTRSLDIVMTSSDIEDDSLRLGTAGTILLEAFV